MPPGTHRRGMKVLVFGPTDGGKSFFLAHMPSPKVILDANAEGGISAYLRPEDECLPVTNPELFTRAIDFILKNEDKIQSVCIDGMTGAWEEFMDFWAQKLGGDIQGGDWRKVKGPWKLLLKRLMRSRLHVGFSAWQKDILYDQQDNAGMKKLEIRQQDVPNIEKTVPYTVDFILKADVVRDRKNVPTPYRTLTVYKARRPRSISPADLYSGKQWKFDQKNPVNPWEIVIEPYMNQWQEGAVDHLGSDPIEEEYEGRLLDAVVADQDLAYILQVIAKQTDLRDYQMAWAKEIDPKLPKLGEERKKLVVEAHARKKAELEAKR